MNSATQTVRSDGWFYVVVFLLLGYMCMGRSFAYWGIPPWYIFVGEVVLAWFLLFGPRWPGGRWPWIARDLRQLKGFKRALYFLIAWGLVGIAHGVYAGYSPLTAIRDFAFDYYPLYFLLGLWVGLQGNDRLPRFFRIFAWVNGIYGVVYILFLSHITWSFPGYGDRAVPVPVFGLPEYSCIALLGLLVFEKSLRRVWPLLLLNGFVMLGMQVRGEWAAFAVGLGIWAWRTRNFKRAMWGGAVVLAMLVLITVTSLDLAGPKSRGGGSISAGGLIGRALAPVDENIAASYTSKYQMDVGTTLFRTLWWAAIWEAVNQNATRALTGFGYGYPLGDLVPYIQGFIQTPHNVFFYALGYTGWVGVVLFFWFLAEIGRLLLRVPDDKLREFGVMAFAAMILYAAVEPYFEAPMGAIPFYLMMGIVAASLFRQRRPPSRAAARLAGGDPGLAPAGSG